MLQWEEQGDLAASHDPDSVLDNEIEELPRYEPNEIHMFRVAFLKKVTNEELKEVESLNGSDLHEHYYLNLEKLKI